MDLIDLGWADPFKTAFESLLETDANLVAARVARAQREHYRLLTPLGPVAAGLSGRLRHTAGEGEHPVTGDWVAARIEPDGERATIDALLPRRGLLARKRPSPAGGMQPMAANVDCVFLVTSLNRDFSPRRIERTLALVWEAAAQPVVLLTKLDACSDPEPAIEQARAVALGVPVHALSALSGQGLEALAAYVRPGRTLALIGSSGVGKSTLANCLLGEARVATSQIRDGDDKGRHTTTARELFLLPAGGVLIDTPGLREVGLWDASDGLDATFEDIAALCAHCRFADCGHGREPGCAVRAELERGALSPERFAAYLKLQRELAHEARRHDGQARVEHNRQVRAVHRQRKRDQRAHPKR